MGAWDSAVDRVPVKTEHKIILDHRQNLQITGADDVISFDETSIVLHTTDGILSVDGDDLHILRLNTDGGDGIMTVTGHISGVFYVDDTTPKKGGFFGRGRGTR